MAAKPPTITKSISASQSFCRRRLISVMLAACAIRSIELQRHFKAGLMLHGSLLGSQSQIFVDQTEIDTGTLSFVDGGHSGSIDQELDGRLARAWPVLQPHCASAWYAFACLPPGFRPTPE